MRLTLIVLVALLGAQPAAAQVRGPGESRPSPDEQIAPHGDPRDQGWRLVGEEGPEGSPPSRTCGGLAGSRCPEAQVCDYRAGPMYPDKAGVCRPRRPQVCTREYRPVCGRNGRTYPNACEAARAKVAVRQAGACRRR